MNNDRNENEALDDDSFAVVSLRDTSPTPACRYLVRNQYKWNSWNKQVNAEENWRRKSLEDNDDVFMNKGKSEVFQLLEHRLILRLSKS